MKVLLAEDDPQIGGAVLRAFDRAGLAMQWVERGDEADVLLAGGGAFDAAVLDIGLPGRDGIDVLRRLRGRGDPLPVLLLTARDEVSDRVLGLDAGADDYLVKPFDMVELEARVRALLRRGRVAAQPAPARLGRLSLHADEAAPRLDEAPMELSPREAGVLSVLLRRAGRVAGKPAVLQELAAADPSAMDLSDAAVEVIVHRLRRKLEGSGAEIHTVRGFGYMLRARDE
ncbi:MAG: response regulator transcription factor [Burkholderiales bacterium]|nr:response regulator transcription factor [Burkholderiales bacterium]